MYLTGRATAEPPLRVPRPGRLDKYDRTVSAMCPDGTADGLLVRDGCEYECLQIGLWPRAQV